MGLKGASGGAGAFSVAGNGAVGRRKKMAAVCVWSWRPRPGAVWVGLGWYRLGA